MSTEISKKNIILVHGAFADRSGWKAVYKLLKAQGYPVTIVQLPLTGLQDDVKALSLALDRSAASSVLVAHSWGGTVITEAGVHPKVDALVYLAAFQPDTNENTYQWFSSVEPAAENGILPPDDKGYVYYDKTKFHAGFCADLDVEEADFLADAQQPLAGAAFEAIITEAAWRTKPAFAVVAKNDNSLSPIIQRKMYERSNTSFVEVESSHAVYISHPEDVVNRIITAAEGINN
ncbi:alpha/beta hydrolase [Sphingobacterium oryzagri]|uniref:Alpha/beta hydrolase n=1 Tax=Sphingobacterium oryzagri TaxID=3025669 RepID=A0ABY7WB62_9SPHI|nr:alpha/beta hydrolase [Sphingobacterium sp. KACC 22765]WDF66873.1 alpha/beta hydrolase [Sphingobacterium sp. KACC 22765]